jgi:hypothetical protein
MGTSKGGVRSSTRLDSLLVRRSHFHPPISSGLAAGRGEKVHESAIREQGAVLHGEHGLLGSSVDRAGRHGFCRFARGRGCALCMDRIALEAGRFWSAGGGMRRTTVRRVAAGQKLRGGVQKTHSPAAGGPVRPLNFQRVGFLAIRVHLTQEEPVVPRKQSRG